MNAPLPEDELARLAALRRYSEPGCQTEGLPIGLGAVTGERCCGWSRCETQPRSGASRCILFIR
jgi:hypothetical protein